MLGNDISKSLEREMLKEKAKREGRPQYEIYVERDFDKFLVALR